MLNDDDFLRLNRWQRRMVALFIGTWAYILIVIAVHLFAHPPERVVQVALVPALGLVVVGGWLQFSIRCPSCGYRLGRQSRLLVPDQCRSCGVTLRRPRAST
jgi:hypothetical protein